MNIALLCAGMAVLSIGSGMLGLGVTFMAAPFLDFFMSDLVHQVQPLSLFLNGVTALFSLFGFAMSGPVVWRPAILLTIVTTATAPLVAWLAQHVAVTSPSFSARIPHIASARVEPSVGR